MTRRIVIVGIAALLGVGSLWFVRPSWLANQEATSHVGPGATPTDESQAGLAFPQPVRADAGGRGNSVAAANQTEEPLLPDGSSKGPASAIRISRRRSLWADPPSNRAGGPGARTKYPADHLPRGSSSLAVTVIDSAGDPIEGASVSLAPPESAGKNSYSHWVGTTDKAGALDVTGLPAGPALLEVYAFSLEAHTAAVELLPAREVTAAVRLDVSGSDFGRVVGRVVDDEGLAVPDAYVESVGSRSFTRTDGAGRFRLDDLPVGRISIETRPDGCAPAEVEVDVPPRAEKAVELRVTYEDPGTNVIRGHVVDPEGRPVTGAEVWVRRSTDKGGWRNAITDEKGAFVLRRLSDSLLVDGVGVNAYAPEAGFGGSDEVEVDTQSAKSDVTITMRPSDRRATLSVRAVDASTGLAARKCLVVAHTGEVDRAPTYYRRREGEDVRLEAAGRDGPFEAKVVPGPYRLTVEAPEFAKWEGRVVVAPPPERTIVPEVRLVRRRPPVQDVELTVVVVAEQPDDPEMSDWQVSVELFDPMDGSLLSECHDRTQDRRYTLPALSGDWRLRVTVSGERVGKKYETFERMLRLPERDAEATVTVRIRSK